MSAAATAAGYLYASGRLRGRNDRGHEHEEEAKPQAERKRPIKVAVYQPEPQAAPDARPKKTPKIEYRTRRWKPE
jgi:hypothetical protein